MVLSEIEQQRAFREAREIMKLGEKWQQLMPGEKRPNFERAAKEVLRRALGQRVQRNVEALDIKEGLMHEHKPREAHLIERFLRSGTVHPDVLHSFVHGDTLVDPQKPEQPALDDMSDLPEFDVFVQGHADQHYPGHWHPGTGEYAIGHHDAHEMHAPRQVQQQIPEGATLPSAYEAVH